MSTLTIIGQIVGGIAAVILIFSFQFKDNKKLFIAQICSCTLFTVHYMLLGFGGDPKAFSGMVQNFGGLLFRVPLLLSEKNEKWRSPIILAALCAYSAVTAVLTYEPGNIVCLLPMIGNIIGMGAMWVKKPNVIRVAQLSFMSPCWLIYNIFTFSISGIITESFNIISIGVYYLRQLIAKRRNKKKELTDEKSEDNGSGKL